MTIFEEVCEKCEGNTFTITHNNKDYDPQIYRVICVACSHSHKMICDRVGVAIDTILKEIE